MKKRGYTFIGWLTMKLGAASSGGAGRGSAEWVRWDDHRGRLFDVSDRLRPA